MKTTVFLLLCAAAAQAQDVAPIFADYSNAASPGCAIAVARNGDAKNALTLRASPTFIVDAEPLFTDMFQIGDSIFYRFTRDAKGRVNGLRVSTDRTAVRGDGQVRTANPVMLLSVLVAARRGVTNARCCGTAAPSGTSRRPVG